MGPSSLATLALSLLVGCGADTFVSPDAGSDGASDAAPPLACGGSSCHAGEACCVYAGSGTPQYQCATSCPQPQNGATLSTLTCASSADCAGLDCCLERTSGVNVSQCAAQCTSGQAQLCDPTAQDAGCPSTAPCSNGNISDWGLPNGFATCGGQGPP